MKLTHVIGGVMLASLAALVAGGRAASDEQLPPPGGSSNLGMTKYYLGSLSSVGEFPGRLVRLSCFKNEPRDLAPRCAPSSHALIVDGDDGVHPLVPGSDEVRTELESPELQKGEVRVHGKYYPSTGAILVNDIAPRCEPSNC